MSTASNLTLRLAQAVQHAGVLYGAGQWDQSEQVCKEILAVRADCFEALNLLGMIAAQTARMDEAERLLRRAARTRPADAAVHNNYGNVLLALGRPGYALQSYSRALAINPSYADAHNNHGIALKDLGRFEDALQSFDQALDIKPEFAEAYNNRGLVLYELGRCGEAIMSYEAASRLAPNFAEAHSNRGDALHALKHYPEAVASYDRALTIAPHHAAAYNNRGTALHDLRRLDEALEDYERALRIDRDFPEAHTNRGNVLQDLNRLPEALACYDRALSIRPDLADAHRNRGNALRALDRFDEAMQSYDRAISIIPDFAAAHFGRAELLLLRGDLEPGWKEYEWRWRDEKSSTYEERREFPQPTWLGRESIAGKTILLYGEQGLGDTLMFCRYVKRVADLGARVILEAPRPLIGVLAGLEGVSQPIAAGRSLPDFDCQCPLLSLPLAFNTTLSTIPGQVPYLRSDPDKVARWQELLGERRRPRVGLVWSGGLRPNQPERATIYARRNLPLSKLAPLAHPDIEFYSLQKGKPAEAELAELIAVGWNGPRMADFSALLHDFADTAALIEQLDLVISVDTSTAHLAGALGKPVWILNRFDTCWRWMLDRTDSPWYPTARLYRQEHIGDWEAVIERVRTDLARLV